jgi:hypothetical protein
MRSPLVALVFVACSGSADPTTSPPPNHPGGSAVSDQAVVAGSGPGSQDSQGSRGSQASQASQAMSTDRKTPGDTGVDEHGVLLRSKPDPNAPKADAALVADDAAQLLFYAGALVGDPAIQRRAWQQLGLADASGAPSPRMTEFIRAHQEWVKVKASAAATVATPANAKAYLDAHLK